MCIKIYYKRHSINPIYYWYNKNNESLNNNFISSLNYGNYNIKFTIMLKSRLYTVYNTPNLSNTFYLSPPLYKIWDLENGS